MPKFRPLASLKTGAADSPGTTAPGAPDGGAGAVVGNDFWVRYSSLLPDREEQTVVVVTDDDTSSPVNVFLRAPRASRVVVISPEGLPEWDLERPGVEHRRGRTLEQVNWELRFLGPVDVLVDLAARTGAEYDTFWRRIFFHLRAKGLYVIDRGRARDDVVPASVLEVAGTVGRSSTELSEAGYTDRPRRLAVAGVTLDAEHVLVTKRAKHVLKLRDQDANRLLPSREPELGLEVLDTRPGGTLTSAARIHSHESAVTITALDETMDYPPVHLRHYTGKIAMVSNALLQTGATALPDSFRHHLAATPGNPRLVDVTREFARPRPSDRPRRRLPGNYYHLDSENSGHYGHLLTEVTARLWGWDRAKEQLPDLKAIFRIRYPNERTPALERRVFGAYGIAPDDICWVDEPVWLESVVAATPMWHNQFPHYVHPDLASVWARIRDSLLAEGTPPTVGFERSGGTRIFVSRRHVTTNRACRNAREVEAFFLERGFDIVYPEDHDLAVQAAIFDRAEVVAGFGGSAMFNVMFSRGYRAMILLNHEAYTARNEHLFTVLLGGDVHYFWSTPDLPHPDGEWSAEAYYSAWAFDFERNSGPLDEVIRGLA